MVFLFQRSRLFIFYHLTFSSDFSYLFFFALYPFLSISSSLLCIRVPLVISLLVFLCLIACNALSSYIMLSFSLLRTFFFLASIALHFFFYSGLSHSVILIPECPSSCISAETSLRMPCPPGTCTSYASSYGWSTSVSLSCYSPCTGSCKSCSVL